MANGNYVPFSASRSDPFQAALPSTVSPAQSITGHGSPEGRVPGNPGQRYTDIDNDFVYTKIKGSQTLGWELVGIASAAGSGGAISGVTGVFSGDGSPVGVIVPLGSTAFYVQKDSDPPGQLWSFYDGVWH